MQTVYGTLLESGISRHRHLIDPGGLRHAQPERIPVEAGHGGAIVGEAVHLEVTPRAVWLVAELDDNVGPSVAVRVGDATVRVAAELYWSGQFDFRQTDGQDSVLLRAAITRTPAQLGLAPLRWLPGRLDYPDVAAERWHLKGFELELLTRAANAACDRRGNGGPIYVRGGRTADMDAADYWTSQAEKLYRQRPDLIPTQRRGEVEHSAHRGGILSVR